MISQLLNNTIVEEITIKNNEKNKKNDSNKANILFTILDSNYRNPHVFPPEESKHSYRKLDKKDKSSKMVKLHQIKSLEKISKYDGTISGLILNFHDENNDNQRTYFIEVNNFINMMKLVGKKSFNELDLLTVGNAKKILGNKKRTRWSWSLDEFFKSYNN